MENVRKTVRVVTPPSFEPVTVIEARQWCRIDDDNTEEDALLMLLITAMREHAEMKTGYSLVTQTLELRLDKFPDWEIELPHPPIQSVTSITYTDLNGATQVLQGSPSNWDEDLHSVPGRITPLYSANWPNTREVLDAVRIRYVAGWATPNAIPKSIRAWMEVRLATLFAQREQVIVGNNLVEMPRDHVDGLLDDWRGRDGFA